MTPMMTTMKQWQDEYFTLVERIEAPVIDLTGRLAESVATYVPARPARLAELPTTKELVENQLKFRRRFVDEQAAFVRRLVKAMDPVLVKFEHVPAKSAPKPAATRATPKTAKPVTRKAATRPGPRSVPRSVAPAA